MEKLVVATKNKGKLKEFKEIFSSLPYELISMEDAGFNSDIDETGTTFEENALIKASTIAAAAGYTTIADDSGLEVDYLNGAPGIYSARFGGEGATDADKNNKLLGMLDGVPYDKRIARFVCAIAVVFPDGNYRIFRATCDGYITTRPEGENGFGYDPLLYIPHLNRTMAQLSSEEKNLISHRGKALKLMLQAMRKEFDYVSK